MSGGNCTIASNRIAKDSHPPTQGTPAIATADTRQSGLNKGHSEHPGGHTCARSWAAS